MIRGMVKGQVEMVWVDMSENGKMAGSTVKEKGRALLARQKGFLEGAVYGQERRRSLQAALLLPPLIKVAKGRFVVESVPFYNIN